MFPAALDANGINAAPIFGSGDQDKGPLFPETSAPASPTGAVPLPAAQGAQSQGQGRCQDGFAAMPLALQLCSPASPAALVVRVNKGWISPPTLLIFCPLQNPFFWREDPHAVTPERTWACSQPPWCRTLLPASAPSLTCLPAALLLIIHTFILIRASPVNPNHRNGFSLATVEGQELLCL